MTEVLKIPHDNNTGRWILPFRAVWGPAGDCAFVGGMRGRSVDVFATSGPSPGKQLAALSHPAMTAIPSRLAPHPLMPVLAAATASGRVHIWR